MNLRKISTRVVVAGATTALAAGALVGLTGTPANAATGTAAYGCTNPYSADVMPLTLSATADLASFPSFGSGFSVPQDIVGVDVAIDLSEEAVAGLKANGINSVGSSSTGMDFPFGSGSATLKGFDVAQAPLPESGGFTMAASTFNESFALPEPGTLDLLMPASFTLTLPTNIIALPLTCTVDGAQGVVTTYTVVKQNATAAAKAPKTVSKNKPFSVVATVAGQYKTATGKVSLKAGSKTVGTASLKNGKATFKFAKGIKKTTKFTAVYQGDTSTNPSTGIPVTVKVKK